MGRPKDGGPAFPMIHKTGVDADGTTLFDYFENLSLRDYFATHAPPCPLAMPNFGDSMKDAAAYLVKWEYTYADAMMKCRDQSRLVE